jgi:hypothetical protein
MKDQENLVIKGGKIQQYRYIQANGCFLKT